MTKRENKEKEAKDNASEEESEDTLESEKPEEEDDDEAEDGKEDAEADAEQEEDEDEDEEKEEKDSSSESRSSSRSRRRSQDSRKKEKTAKSVVPMWFWVVSVVVLLGFSAMLMFRYEGRLKDAEETFNANMEKAAKEIQNREDIISEKNDIISREKNRVAALSVEKRSLTSQVAGLNSDISTHKDRISALEKEIASLKKTVSGNNADIAGKEKEIARLTGELHKMKKDMAALRIKQKKTEKAMKSAQEKEKVIFAQMMAVMRERDKYKDMVKDYKEDVVPALKEEIKKLEGGEDKEKEED